MMGALKGEFFSQQILNKNSLSLAHCAPNRSFMVHLDSPMEGLKDLLPRPSDPVPVTQTWEVCD